MLKKTVPGLMLMLILVGILTANSQRPRMGTFKQRDVYKELEDQAIVVSHAPTTRDFEEMKDRIGVWREDAKYDQTVGCRGTGLLPPTEQEWTKIKDDIHVVDEILLDQTTTIPSMVDHSVGPWFPPVGDQEGENSCVAWAVAYYTKTFQEAKEHDWNLTDAEWEEEGHPTQEFQDEIFSPDFVYHLINGGVDGGSTFSEAIDLVAFLGACSWKNMPYDSYNYTSWPSEEAWREASFYRANSSGIEYMELGTDDDIVSLKNWIASDHLALISVDGHQYSELTDKDFWTLDNYDNRSTNHANTIVGFDDDIRYFEHGEWRYGAFKIANSWGKGGWENVPDGCYWISYEAMKERIGYCMFYRDKTEYYPELVSSFQLEHLKSDDCEISIGIGNHTNPLTTKSFSHIVETGERPFCPNKVVFDITELKDNIPTVINQSFFISVYDKGMPTTHSGTNGWRANGSSYSWFRLGQTFDIPENGATLKFWSYYEIEEDWDYGYVEVHDLDEDEWYTLPGLQTKSTLPEPQDNPNCPSAFEPSAYYDAERWNAFTGFSKAMYQEEMDLSPFANHTIELCFTYWTDPLVLERGWYIDDIEITEIGLFDDVENDQGNWTNNGWYIAVPESPSTGTISSFSIENYHINSSALIATSSSPTVPVNTEDQNYVFVGLILHAYNAYTDINVPEAEQMIKSNPNLVILDVRTLEEYNEGHIENAVLIPVGELESRLDELDVEDDFLVYCRSGTRSATASQILVDNGFSIVYNMLGGITAWRDAGYWIEIIHEGDLIISETQTFVIEDCIYIQAGDIIVKDYSELYIRNATLILNSSSANPWGIVAENHATMEIENVKVKGNNGVHLNCTGNTVVSMNFTSVEDWFYCSDDSTITVTNTAVQVFTISGRSTVSMTDSAISHLYFIPSATISLDNVKPGLNQYWNLHENQTYAGEAEITVKNTMVNHWSFSFNHEAIITNSTLSFDCDRADINDITILVIDSLVESVGLRVLGGAEVTLNDLSPEFYEHYELSEHAQGIRTNIVFQNATIAGWCLWAGYDTIITLANSTIEGLQCTENSRITMNGSIIDSPQNWDVLWFSDYSGIIVFEKSEVNDGIMTLTSDFLVLGNITFTEDAYIESWERTDITRNLNIVVLNKTVPSENISLSLYSQNNTIVWNGATDSLGKANFNLTFTDLNHTNTLRLEAAKGNYSATINVDFLSNTPIVLTMRYFADLNADGTINILDISAVAIAFGSTAEDPDWNVIVDLNNDHVINILDISTIATEFGKTV